MTALPWRDIDTVLLDMDGTLLDLHYDTDNRKSRGIVTRSY